VEVADALTVFVLSVQSCSHDRLTRSLPPKAGIGKGAGLERVRNHPEAEITTGGNRLQGNSWMKGISRFP
jgi:hypothetical protein